ncbi:GntR family transcriptional regulator [Cellulosilyticum sp. I15G10I2]|uniref:GntR family transcriptional regulator n=1 Tax=Cellulosilyticum sp. I15G10I2 TaxID=1892843 RepID=UPI00085CCD0B|nr:GntR family transcriptional regulator [Cellulosilyticum sp. I15G10I2]
MFPIDVRDVRPIYEQIIDNVKEQVIKGILKPGDQIPSVRQLAGMLTVNVNTVTKAYQQLERQRIIETIRGKGTFVADIHIKAVDQEELQDIRKILKSSCMQLHYMGFSKQDMQDEISRIYDGFIKEEKS